jgi:putative phage-type endonuclease
MIQGSDEWHTARLGKVTASRVADLMARTKTGWGASRANYMAELLCERLTGRPTEHFTNAAMQWGKDVEPQARAAYEFLTGADVTEVGFVDHPSIVMAGASPDGLSGTSGLVEIKCPNSATHIETLLSETVPAKYRIQMLWQIACTGRGWCDFVSFDPRLPADMQIWIRRIEPEAGEIEAMEAAVREFLLELDDKIDRLRSKYAEAA